MSLLHQGDPRLMATKKNEAAEPNGNDEKPFLAEEDLKLLRKQYLADYHEEDVNMFLRRCERTKIDPMTGQIFMRPDAKEETARGQDGKYRKALTITGIQGFRGVADRSGVFDGTDPILWCGADGVWTDIWLQDKVPYAAKASAWRKDQTRPHTVVVKWRAVSKPGWAWTSMPDHMLGKCAEAAALRKAFPNQLAGVYETDEIVDHTTPASTFDQDVEDQKKRIADAEVAKEKLTSQGVPSVQPSAPVFPRDPVKEIEPAKGLEPKEYQPGDEPDDTNLLEEPDRPADWWMHLSCDIIQNQFYTGKVVHELSPNLLKQAVEKWVPRVRSMPDAAKVAVDLADALEIGLAQAEKVQEKLASAASASANAH